MKRSEQILAALKEVADLLAALIEVSYILEEGLALAEIEEEIDRELLESMWIGEAE